MVKGTKPKNPSTPPARAAKEATPKVAASKVTVQAAQPVEAPRNEAAAPVKSAAVNGKAAALAPTHQQIAERAFELFMKRGGTDGNHLDDWFQAEQELRHHAPTRARV